QLVSRGSMALVVIETPIAAPVITSSGSSNFGYSHSSFFWSSACAVAEKAQIDKTNARLVTRKEYQPLTTSPPAFDPLNMQTGVASAQPKRPWDVDPALKAARLSLLSKVAVETRNRAFGEANRDQGDTNWGLGCKAHERFCHALCVLAEGAESPWLRVRR